MGWTMLSKSLIQLSIDEWVCVPSLLFDLRPNSGGGNEDNGYLLQKVPCTHCSVPNPAAGHLQPKLLPETPGQIMGKSGSVSWGHCSFLLGPGVHKVLFVPSKCLFPKSCISSRGSMVVLMVTSSKRAYVLPKSAAPRAPALAAGHY